MTSFEDVATLFEVELCGGCDAISAGRHRRGCAAGNTVHWAPRRLNRRGLRTFLKLVATLRVFHYGYLNQPMQIYTQNMWSLKAARQLRIRFPRSYSRVDRLIIRWLASQGHEISSQARRWAERKEI